jgi:hypothetical protein
VATSGTYLAEMDYNIHEYVSILFNPIEISIMSSKATIFMCRIARKHLLVVPTAIKINDQYIKQIAIFIGL